jgi:hypothetical protein
MAVDRKGRIFVADSANHRVQVQVFSLAAALLLRPPAVPESSEKAKKKRVKKYKRQKEKPERKEKRVEIERLKRK